MAERATEGVDCPNCGVYNPAGRIVCWRCDRELPKPKEKKKKKSFWSGRSWLYVLMAVLLGFSLLQLCALPMSPEGGESGWIPFLRDLAVSLPPAAFG